MLLSLLILALVANGRSDASVGGGEPASVVNQASLICNRQIASSLISRKAAGDQEPALVIKTEADILNNSECLCTPPIQVGLPRVDHQPTYSIIIQLDHCIACTLPPCTRNFLRLSQ